MNVCLIIGVARSGTSILGELVSQHRDIHYEFEAHDVWELDQTNCDRMTDLDVTYFGGRAIRMWFEAKCGKKGWIIEKNPKNILRIPYVKKVFPEAKLIMLWRDLRDVTCSMVPGLNKFHFAHHKPPSWERFAGYGGLIRSAWVCRECIEIATKDLKGVDHMNIHFESMLKEPERIAHNICSYLGLSDSEEMQTFCKNISDDTIYQAKHQTQWVTKDHNERVGRWKHLKEEDRESLNNILKPVLEVLGYGS